MRDEFLYKWPGGRHLITLIELEKRMDGIIADQIRKDANTADEIIIEKMRTEFANRDCTLIDKIMVEVFDARILRSNSPESATIGKMSVHAAVDKFH